MNALGIVKRIELGGDVDAWCGKCKEIREHVIAALNDQGGIGRVQCRTCQSNHLFRERKTRTVNPGTSSRALKSGAGIDFSDSGPSRSYSMLEQFEIGDRVDHPRFGVGTVIDVRSGKIDVKFGREVKTLIHAG